MGTRKHDVRRGPDNQSGDGQRRASPPREQRNARRGRDHERDEPELRDALDLALQRPFTLAEARGSRGVIRRDAA